MRRSAGRKRPPSTILTAILAALAMLVLAALLDGRLVRALSPVIDLDSTPAGLTVYGDNAADQSGWAAAARAPAGGAGSSEQGMS